MSNDKAKIGWHKTPTGYECQNIGVTIDRQVGTGKPLWVLRWQDKTMIFPSTRAAKRYDGAGVLNEWHEGIVAKMATPAGPSQASIQPAPEGSASFSRCEEFNTLNSAAI
jgi:hypothetical protein